MWCGVITRKEARGRWRSQQRVSVTSECVCRVHCHRCNWAGGIHIGPLVTFHIVTVMVSAATRPLTAQNTELHRTPSCTEHRAAATGVVSGGVVGSFCQTSNHRRRKEGKRENTWSISLFTWKKCMTFWHTTQLFTHWLSRQNKIRFSAHLQSMNI